MKKVIITCALTGSVPSKEKFPALPITVDEIVKDAIAVYEAGSRRRPCPCEGPCDREEFS